MIMALRMKRGGGSLTPKQLGLKPGARSTVDHGERWNVPAIPSDPRDTIAATFGASGVGSTARTFRGAGAGFLKERQAYAEREMENEYANPHPDPGVHRAYMMQLADTAVSARDELRRQGAAKPPASDTAKQSLTADIARANQNLEQIRKKNLPIDEHHAETAKWHNLKQGAEQKLAKMPASEQRGTQEGARGGRFYIAATGAKVYVKNNPGAETVGHMSNQRFHQGLPMSVHLAEPKKSR